MALKIVHTADVHLGATFGWLGPRGREQRRELLQALSRIVGVCIEEDARLLLIAGDLFDSNNPPPACIDCVRRELAVLSDRGVLVRIIPGTHDCYGAESVYVHADLCRGISGARVVAGLERERFASLDLTLHTRGNDARTSRSSPLGGMARDGDSRYNVAMVHGSLELPGRSREDDYPLLPEEVAASGLDYIACGHWHSYFEMTAGGTVLCYSGSPELISPADDAGWVVVVSAAGGEKLARRRVRVGKRSYREVEIDAGLFRDRSLVRARLDDLVDPDVAVRVRIVGGADEAVLDAGEFLQDEFGGKFFALDVLDASVPGAEEESFPGYSVPGRFVRRMKEFIAAAPDEEERLIRRDALRLGLVAMRGGEVV